MKQLQFYRANVSGRRSLKGNIRYVFRKFLQFLAGLWCLPSPWRVALQARKGVRFADPRSVFLGKNVYFDDLFPDKIHVGKNVMITLDAVILAHYYDPSFKNHVQKTGVVRIADGVYIGARSLVVKPVTIGRGAVVAANSVVNKDIPPFAVVAGSPAKVVGRRGDEDPTPIRDIPSIE